MIALTEADDTFELFLRDLEAQGSDINLPLMREANKVREEILGIPTGDDTPLPGALIVEPEPLIVFPPPVHEGWNETHEGKFLIPASAGGGKPEKHITFRELCRQFRRFRRITYSCLLGLAMVFAGAILVARWNW